MTDTTRAAEIARLREAIRASGLSITEYARHVLVRDGRTLRRWLAGDRQIPRAVLDLCEQMEQSRRAYVDEPANVCGTCGQPECPGERLAF